jgi:hypothetical protein
MRSLKGKSEVVAPISAPLSKCQFEFQAYREIRDADMLQMVAATMLAMIHGRFFRSRGLTHAGSRDGVDTGTVVLDNRAGTALDSEDTSDLENDVLRGGPARQLARQLNTDDLGGLQLPGEVGHDIDGVSTRDDG